MRLVALSLLAASACVDGSETPNATLASLSAIGAVHVNVDFYANHPIWIGVGIDGVADSGHFAYPNCLLLDDTFGGTAGGLSAQPSPGGNWEDERKCNAVGLTVVGDGALPTQSIEVHDRTTSIVATYAPTAFAPRYADHPSWEFVPGSSTSFTWSHPPDLANSSKVYVSFRPTMGGDLFQFAVPTNNEIQVVVPSSLPTGDVDVYFELYDYTPVPALECVNAASCTTSFFPPEYHHMGVVK